MAPAMNSNVAYTSPSIANPGSGRREYIPSPLSIMTLAPTDGTIRETSMETTTEATKSATTLYPTLKIPPPASTPLFLLAVSRTIFPITEPDPSRPYLPSCYTPTIDLPRDLKFRAPLPLEHSKSFKGLLHVQLLRLWEVLREMRDAPERSPFIDWSEMSRDENLDVEAWKDTVHESVKAAEYVLKKKWGEEIRDEEAAEAWEKEQAKVKK